MTDDAYPPCGRQRCDRLVYGSRTTPRTVCGACLGQYERALRDVVDLVVELEVTATRQHRTAPVGGTIVTSSPTRPLPLHARAVTALRALEGDLAAAYQATAPAPCACVTTPTGPECLEAWGNRSEWLPEHAAPAQVAGYLASRIDDLAALDEFPPLVDALLDDVAEAERTIDNPPDLVFAGPCSTCGNDLYAHADRELVRCVDRPDAPGCGAVYDLTQRRAHLLESLRDHTATAAAIAHGLAQLAGVKIDRRVVNVWAGRTVDGRPKLADRRTPAQRRATDPPVAPRYRIGDVLDLAAASAVEAEARRARARDARAARAAADEAGEDLDEPAGDAGEGQVETRRAS